MASDAQFSVIAETVRRMKREKVVKYGNDPDEELSDLMNFCAGVRAGKQLFVVYNGPGPLSARQCAYWTALYLSCDEIFLVADARYKTVESEEGYGPGTLTNMWNQGDREGIQECIIVHRYPYIGPRSIAHYDYLREGNKLTWGAVRFTDPEIHQEGAIDDHVQAGFAKRREVQPTIDKMLRVMHSAMDRQGFPPDERPYWTDRGMAKYVSSREGVFLVQYLSHSPGLPDAVFKDGHEVDPETGEPLD